MSGNRHARGPSRPGLYRGLLAAAREITIATIKPDKYDRYLADIFLTPGDDGPEVFLYQALLDAGHAVLNRTWEFGDWA